MATHFYSPDPITRYGEVIRKNNSAILIVRIPVPDMTLQHANLVVNTIMEQLHDLNSFFARVFFIPDKSIESIKFEIIDVNASQIRAVESSNVEDIKKILEDEKRNRGEDNPFV